MTAIAAEDITKKAHDFGIRLVFVCNTDQVHQDMTENVHFQVPPGEKVTSATKV